MLKNATSKLHFSTIYCGAILSTMFMYGKEIRTTLTYGYYVNVYLLFILE